MLRMQGRSQAYLCRMMGKSTNTLSLWCTNKIQPSLPDLYRIAKILNCKVADLLLEEGEIELLKKKSGAKK